jgi:hypothetical protein
MMLIEVFIAEGAIAQLWRIKTTWAHRSVGRRCCAAWLADRQVSPARLAFAPRLMLIETAIAAGKLYNKSPDLRSRAK